VSVAIPDALRDEVVELIAEGRTITAVKRVKEELHLDLFAATDVVLALRTPPASEERWTVDERLEDVRAAAKLTPTWLDVVGQYVDVAVADYGDDPRVVQCVELLAEARQALARLEQVGLEEAEGER
jgi:hypothetical protein